METNQIEIKVGEINLNYASRRQNEEFRIRAKTVRGVKASGQVERAAECDNVRTCGEPVKCERHLNALLPTVTLG